MSYSQTRTTLEPGKLYKNLHILQVYLDKPSLKGKQKSKTTIDTDSILLAITEQNPPSTVLDLMGGGFHGFWVVYNDQTVWLPENEFCYLTRL